MRRQRKEVVVVTDTVFFPKKGQQNYYSESSQTVPYFLMVKVQQFLYRPGQAMRVSGSLGSQISRKSEYKDGKVIRPTYRQPLPPRKYSWYSFLLEAE